MSRDRDPAGRPRNARSRDALGRPLPRTGQRQDEVLIPEDLPPGEAVRLADELLRAGRPFHAHEVLEAAWKSGPASERDLWQGLAQIAVGLTHAHRGNARGAVTLLRRGAARVRGFQERPDGAVEDVYGIDVAGVLGAAEALADRVERDGVDGLPPGALKPGLI